MITFDDGYTSGYDLVLPILREMEVKAVIAPIIQRLDDGVGGYLTWDMCREMARSGLVEFGSHTYALHGEKSAQSILRKDDERQEDYEDRVFGDLQCSIDRLEEELGVTVCYFAFPFGLVDPWAEDFVNAHFQFTVTTAAGAVDISGGLQELPRYHISTKSRPWDFLPSLFPDHDTGRAEQEEEPQLPSIPVVTVNGFAVRWPDATPFINKNNRTMAPLRAVGDALGLTVGWDAAKREAIFTDGEKTIYFPIGSSAARTSDGGMVRMDTAAAIINDRTYAPVRYLAEYFGHIVSWDGDTKTVVIR